MLTDDAKDPRAVPTKMNMLDAMHWLVTGAQTHDSLLAKGGRGRKKDASHS